MKNLIKVIISGIAIGITFLMMGYVGIYYALGETFFIKEITELSQIGVLKYQLAITGLSGMLLTLSFYFVEKTMSQYKTNNYKVMFSIIFLTISAIISMMLTEQLNENISDMLVIMYAIIVCLYALFNCARTFIKDVMSSSNNKKDKVEKENNSQETEEGN